MAGRLPETKQPMLKICRIDDGGLAVFALSGRIEHDHVRELKTLFGAEPGLHRVTLDLEEVTLVDREVIRFLAVCEAGGIKLENCPSYIREWIDMGKERSDELE
jgi:hypothetical protein